MKIRELVSKLMELRDLDAEVTVRVALFDERERVVSVRHAPISYMYGNQIAIHESHLSDPVEP